MPRSNALGGALLAANKISDAIAHLSAAASARPDYFDAHFNLGIATGNRGNFSSAIQELTPRSKLKPDDAVPRQPRRGVCRIR